MKFFTISADEFFGDVGAFLPACSTQQSKQREQSEQKYLRHIKIFRFLLLFKYIKQPQIISSYDSLYVLS